MIGFPQNGFETPPSLHSGHSQSVLEKVAGILFSKLGNF